MHIDPNAPNQMNLPQSFSVPSVTDREKSASSARIGPRVFVVDDEQIIAMTVAAILEMSGFSATAFTSPVQALERAKSESPDLLISDVMMPEMSGVDLALRIKEECPNCDVLLFSGQAATSDLLWKSRRLGHDFHLLLKPVHPTDLLCEVRNRLNPSTPLRGCPPRALGVRDPPKRHIFNEM